jgi:NTE family protein
VRRRAPAPTTVLAVSSLGVFMAFVDATIVNIAFPDIAESFPDTSISSLTWVLNAYNIVFAAFLVAAGRIADLLGRRRIFLVGLVIFTFASVLCAVAPSANALIGFRLLQALGAAFVVPASLGLVLQAFPVERRAHAVALLSAVAALAAGVGPSLGGLLVAADSWRLVFLVNLPVGIVAYVLSRRQLVESREPGRRQMPDLLGAMIFAVAIAALVLAVVKGDEWGWDSPRILGAFAVALALGAIFFQRSTSHRSPMIDPALLRIRTFSVANSMTVLAAAGFFGYTLINVLFLTQVWQYSVLEAGLAITPGPVVATVIAGPSSKVAERIGHRWVLVAGGLIWGLGLIWFIERAALEPDFLGVWLPGMIILGIGAGILFPNLSATAVASAPGEAFATATGINSVLRQVGAALGVAAVIAILGTPNPLDPSAVESAFDNAWTFSAVCLLLAGIGCLGVGRLRTEDDVRKSPSLGSAARLILRRDSSAREAAPIAPAPIRRRFVPEKPPEPRPESAADFLARAPIFADLPKEMREKIARSASELRLAAGDWLFHEGDEGDALYVIRAGRLEVIAGHGDGSVMRVLGRGAALGELALLTSSPRSASARATRDTDLIAIEREHFQRLLEEAPEVALALTRTLGAQLRDSVGVTPRSRGTPVTIALVPLDQRAPLDELGRRLADSLGHWGRVDLLDAREAAPAGGEEPVAVFAPLLDRAEATNDQVVLVAGTTSNAEPWTAFCLQQADRILAVGSGGDPPPAERRRPELQGCDLVAWEVAEGSGALSAWAEALDPIETHAVDAERSDADIARIARRLAGHSLGIVLSGGGARAFSHIGVLEELEASGLEIDRVAGVSMGAFIGGMFAMGMTADEIDARCYDEWIRRRPLGDYTLPRYSLIRGDRAKAMLRRTFGTVSIEELRRGFFSGAAELRSGELVVHRWGQLWDAVGTSFAIPVIAPAQVRGRRILVDGSLVDNLPVAEMAALGEGPIVAVDVKATVERPGRPAGQRAPEGDGAAREQELRTPSLGETLARVLLLGSSNTSESARRHADWIITPQAEGVGLLEFHQLDQAREAGRAAARAALEEAPASVLA